MGDDYPHSGMDLAKALALARGYGCKVVNRWRHGEYKVTHRRWNRVIVVSRHRKDAPRILTTFLKRLITDAPVGLCETRPQQQ